MQDGINDAAKSRLKRSILSIIEDRLAAVPAFHHCWIKGKRTEQLDFHAVCGFPSAGRALPPGLLDTSVRKLADGRYLGAVILYSSNPDATVSLSASDVAALRAEAGPFVTFSYDSVGADIQARLVRDSRMAALWTTAGVVLIVSALFRKVRVIAVVLLPIVYGTVATVGALALAGHLFSGMAFAAFPLIVGIGIDNSIHLVRRHLDAPDSSPANCWRRPERPSSRRT